jgi:diaminopimelate epimerase
MEIKNGAPMRFTKVHGLGNDFVVIDGRGETSLDYAGIACRLCDRRTGIGADGLLIVCGSKDHDVRMRVINSDGTEAAMCGNGLRAFSKYVFERGIVRKQEFEVETSAGVMRPKLTADRGIVTEITVDMGKPAFSRPDIPMKGSGTFVLQKILSYDRTFDATSLLMGVPHTAVFADDALSIDLKKYGADIEHNELFPMGTNVNFVHVLGRRNIEVRTWERGCGATLACGTCSCASAAACALSGMTERRIDVHLALGTLNIEWAEDGTIFMTGPAKTVFDGEIDLNEIGG